MLPFSIHVLSLPLASHVLQECWDAVLEDPDQGCLREVGVLKVLAKQLRPLESFLKICACDVGYHKEDPEQGCLREVGVLKVLAKQLRLLGPGFRFSDDLDKINRYWCARTVNVQSACMHCISPTLLFLNSLYYDLLSWNVAPRNVLMEPNQPLPCVSKSLGITCICLSTYTHLRVY